jgi:NAD(P)-dependent dehydrogenase (short-subunit alcohol dehydrogenase family)
MSLSTLSRSIKGSVAIVTGAASGMGAATAKLFADQGARVAAIDINAEPLAAVVGEIEAAGREAKGWTLDLSDGPAIARTFAEIGDHFGAIDILVNNAGVSIPKGLLVTSLKEWQLVTGVVLQGMFLVTQAVVSRLVEAKKPGAIVNIGSTSGHRGRKNAIAYCTAKGGVLNFTRALAIELAPFGIRVNSVSPTKTGGALAGESAATRSFSEIPLGRLGQPQDHANAVLFLVSAASAFITGEDIRVDGGTLATWGTKSHPDPVAGERASR